MADGLDVRFEGLDEALDKLVGLPIAYRRKGVRFAGRKAANVIRDAAASNAQRHDDPRTSESIARNIAIRFSNKTFRRTGDVSFRIGVLGGAKSPAIASGELVGNGKRNPGGDTFYWRFLEFGTQNIPAQPFMRPALTQNIQQATTVFIEQLDKWTARNLKKIKRTGA